MQSDGKSSAERPATEGGMQTGGAPAGDGCRPSAVAYRIGERAPWRPHRRPRRGPQAPTSRFFEARTQATFYIINDDSSRVLRIARCVEAAGAEPPAGPVDAASLV
jgi:hypothetical protein